MVERNDLGGGNESGFVVETRSGEEGKAGTHKGLVPRATRGSENEIALGLGIHQLEDPCIFGRS